MRLSTWFTYQPRTVIEIGWWLMNQNFEIQNKKFENRRRAKKPKDKALCFELDGLVTGHVIMCICRQDERNVQGQTYKKCIYTTTHRWKICKEHSASGAWFLSYDLLKIKANASFPPSVSTPGAASLNSAWHAGKFQVSHESSEIHHVFAVARFGSHWHLQLKQWTIVVYRDKTVRDTTI